MSARSGPPDGAFWGDVGDDEALRRYRTLVNTIDDGVYQLDTEGRFVAVNDVLVEMTGYPREELLGEYVSIALAAADIERIEREIASRIETADRDVATFELGIQTADGGSFPCELRVNLLTEAGEFQGTIGVARDISQEKQRLATLESAQASYASITNVLDEANIGVFVLDGEFDVAWADETIERYFGLDRHDLIGRDKRQIVRDIVMDTVVDPDRFAERVLATYDDNSYIEEFECHVTAGDDREERWLEHRSKPIESGQYAGGRIELYYDVSDQKRSEDARRETEERFQSLVDAVEEYAIFRLDRDGNVISWNEGAKEIKGYDPDEILGEHFSTFYTEEDRAADVPQQNLARATEAGSVEDEGWRVREDGTWFWANVTITAIRDGDGTHRGYLKVTRDMTDRHEREQKLQSELQRVFGRISDAFYAIDEEFRFTHVNERAEELLQRSTEDLLGENIWEAFPYLAGVDDVWDAFRTAMDSQEATSLEFYNDNMELWIEANLYPSETGISVYFQDVTERKEREQELQRKERRFEAIFNDPNILVGLLAPDGTTLDINQTAMEYIDAELEDVTGGLFWETPWWGDGDGVRSDVKRWTERAATGEYVEFETDLTRPDGQKYTLNGVFRPVTDDAGDVVSIIASDRDVTERREYERALEESNERLEQFAYAASHDLREPLRMVTSYLRLIETRYADELDEDGREFIDFAVDGAERMREMIEGLLEYSRIETQGDPFEPVDLNDVLQAVREDLRVRIEESDAEITAEELPRVDGDDSQLRQVLQNLLENAIEYSGDEPPRIDVSAERDGTHWIVSVHDEGVGLEPGAQERIFEVFERLHARDEHPGTGIGLALCRRVVERHDGEIWAESRPGDGTTFSFTLPVADDHDE